MSNTIGKRIAALRREKGFKQEELAEMLGVSSQAVSKWENDVSCPDIMMLHPLSEALGITVDELLTGERADRAVKFTEENKRKDIKDMVIHIIIMSHKGKEVKINLPAMLVLDASDPKLSIGGFGALEDDIDWQNIKELIENGAVGRLLEISDHKGGSVEIIVE